MNSIALRLVNLKLELMNKDTEYYWINSIILNISKYLFLKIDGEEILITTV